MAQKYLFPLLHTAQACNLLILLSYPTLVSELSNLDSHFCYQWQLSSCLHLLWVSSYPGKEEQDSCCCDTRSSGLPQCCLTRLWKQINMSEGLHGEMPHDWGMRACAHVWDAPCHTHTLYRGKKQSTMFIKACQNLLAQQQKNELCKTQKCSHTHMHSKGVIFNICLSSLACQLQAQQARRQAVCNSGQHCHAREGFIATETEGEIGTASSASRTQPLLLRLSSFAAVPCKWLTGTRAPSDDTSSPPLPSPWKLLSPFSVVFPLVPSGDTRCCNVCAH